VVDGGGVVVMMIKIIVMMVLVMMMMIYFYSVIGTVAYVMAIHYEINDNELEDFSTSTRLDVDGIVAV
jgi:hypothetical protein